MSFADVLELSVDQLKVELEGRYIESKGLSAKCINQEFAVRGACSNPTSSSNVVDTTTADGVGGVKGKA